jgi:hypothetical protein
MAYYAQFSHLLTYMEQTTPNEFGETLMELSAEASATLAAETDEMRAAKEEYRQDWDALLSLNIRECARIGKTYRGRTGLGAAMEAGVKKVKEAYFEAKAEAKAVAQAKAQEMAQAKAQAMAQAKAQEMAQIEELR